MSNLVALTGKLAELFGMDGNGVMETLKATAFKGPVSDAQMTALLVVARSVRINSDGCWEWTGATSRGYGQLTYQGKHYTAHRFSFANFVEPIKVGLWVLHHCDNPVCVNPEHLYQGSPRDNRADMLNRNRWTHPWASRAHCSKGHEYELDGFHIAKDGSRVCRTCQRDHKRAQRAAIKGV